MDDKPASQPASGPQGASTPMVPASGPAPAPHAPGAPQTADPAIKFARRLGRVLQEQLVPMRDARSALGLQDRIAATIRAELHSQGLELRNPAAEWQAAAEAARR